MELDRERARTNHASLLKHMANRFEAEFGGHFTRETLEHYLADSYEQLAAHARLFDHLPPLVERFAQDRLRAIAAKQGLIAGPPLEVLFVCERNDGTSQMAAALFNSRAAGRAHAHSAGAAPASGVRAEANIAMSELGVSLTDEYPKPVTAEIEAAADVIVTLAAHDDIAILEDKRYFAWQLPDRHGEGLHGFRAMRDDLAERVDRFITEVLQPAPESDSWLPANEAITLLDDTGLAAKLDIEEATHSMHDETVSPDSIEAMIRDRAHQLYEDRGQADGDDLADWLEAERQLREEGRLELPMSRTARERKPTPTLR